MDTGTHDLTRPRSNPPGLNPDRELEMPRRLLGLARDALLNGWMVLLDQRADGIGWRIIIRDERHCMHMAFKPTEPGRLDRHGPWSHTRTGLWGACAAQEARVEVRVASISRWLAEHPEQCKGDAFAAALTRAHGCHCSTVEDGHADKPSA